MEETIKTMEETLDKNTENMTPPYRTFLKQAKICPESRWILSKDKNGKVRGVKLVYKPEEYKNDKLYNKEEIISALDQDYLENKKK